MPQSASSEPLLAIGARLRRFPQVRTLGARADLGLYSAEDMDEIRRARRVLYPTVLLAEPLAALGKPIFPSPACHALEGDKIKQTRLFQLLGLPHPRTRVYYGRQVRDIEADFGFPLVAKQSRGSSLGRGVWLIRDRAALEGYLAAHQPAYIQEYLPVDRDLRVVLLGGEVVCAYWRVAAAGCWRSNLAQGGRVEPKGVPFQAVELARELARRSGLDETGVDVIVHQGQPYLVEFTMMYGLTGPRSLGLDLPALVVQGLLEGRL